jgi:uncharacterized membrane protein
VEIVLTISRHYPDIYLIIVYLANVQQNILQKTIHSDSVKVVTTAKERIPAASYLKDSGLRRNDNFVGFLRSFFSLTFINSVQYLYSRLLLCISNYQMR